MQSPKSQKRSRLSWCTPALKDGFDNNQDYYGSLDFFDDFYFALDTLRAEAAEILEQPIFGLSKA
jgi:hypothetical protein